jgi:alkylhydroperoxidase family enzyme
MQWYPLRDEVQAFLGSRATTLFVHAISTQTDCLICSTFFRRALVEMGEDPDRFTMNQQESTLVEFARQLVDDPNRVDDSLYGRLAEFLDPPQIVVLTTFGAIMIATNTFNNALNVDLDVELEQYRRPATRAETS